MELTEYVSDETRSLHLRYGGDDPGYYKYSFLPKDSLDISQFPEDREVIAFANSKKTLVYDPQNGTLNVEMPSLQEGLTMAMQLKAIAPDEPVTIIHNHPKATENNMRRLFNENPNWVEDAEHKYEEFSKAPSAADMQLYGMLRAFAQGAIYHQADDKIRLWTNLEDRSNKGTHLAISKGMYGTSLYWASPEENRPNTTYISPDKWDTSLVENLDWMNFSYNPSNK